MGFDVYERQSLIRLRLRLVRIGDAPPFSASDRQRLEGLIPLMDNALTLYSAYTHNRFIEQLYEELLGSMDIACIIMNARLEVLSANRQASEILAARDGVLLRHNVLACAESADQQKLEEQCRNVLDAVQGEQGPPAARTLTVQRTGLDAKWNVQVRSVEKKNVTFGEGGPELVLLLRGPVRDCVPSQARLMDLFGVTPAEAKLVAHLVDGQTLTAAAKALGISRNTARGQLASVFTKTGVNRQNQLVRLVSGAVAAHWD
ncbi:MAG: hypothetical protein CME43_05505 [Haliea sp.]|nr:helix-turn-helix transcriptional regulator [Haliea sp.]MBM68914.1 hypothetical protein [Haliea sp.]|tara:strand:+ start:17072 stop:17851 length:780 start_codon:yes stop_codon:yes gene_type:complete